MYVLDALCEMGYIMEATQRMKKRYREMVEYDYSMLWEYWDKGGSLSAACESDPPQNTAYKYTMTNDYAKIVLTEGTYHL